MLNWLRKEKKMGKKHNIAADYLAYLALRIFIVFLSIFDIETNHRFARFLGRLMWDHYHRGRERAIDNLRASFPDKSDEWILQTGKRSFEHVVMLAIDVLFSPRFVQKNNWRDYSRYKHAERAKWMIKENKGMLMLTAHYGNFEIVGYLLGLFDFNIYSIARPLDNRFINDYLYGVRRKHGQKIIDKKGASQLMTDIAQSGATLCFIADQDAGRKGVFVDFFGRKASTYKSIGLLAITKNIPIGVGYCRIVDGRFYFEIGVNRIIMPEEWQDKEDPLHWVTAQYTKAIEDFIREDPSQYWWLHRRWKHRPKEELKQKTSTSEAMEIIPKHDHDSRQNIPANTQT